MTVSAIASESLAESARQTRASARHLGTLSTSEKNAAIEAIANALEAASEEILAANAADCDAARADGIPKPLYDRLKLDATKLQGAIAGVRNVARLPDPVGAVQLHRELDTGLVLKRITCPLGVLGIIFEARPDAVIQISSLAVKSGNGAILKGGKEAVRSCQAIVAAIHRGLENVGLPAEAIALLTTREEIVELLKLDNLVDLIIPRGSNSFVRFVQDNTRIPVLGHADGICHVYVDKSADTNKAVSIAVDAKIQYPAACNAMETLLVHQNIAEAFLPEAAQALRDRGVELRGDEAARQIVEMPPATEADWRTEYNDLVLSVRVVDSLETAVDLINTYGSRHTDAIVTEDETAARTFLNQVDAAGVFHNCSTRFSDGFRYGFGAEVGISTQKLPPRGPVGLDGLVTYKYQVVGDGHVAATYAGRDAQPFTHRDLP
ncbi:MAG: glutamate-5-semialdehyde dehydrogenase [Cyanobacteria bacterium SBC]|nr:glutamate-5-semialdehyde dehydrogenase [Cyanobacteria bacterium SBC]